MYHIEHCNQELMLASYWVSETFLYDGFQVSYGLSEWPSHSISRIWLQKEED